MERHNFYKNGKVYKIFNTINDKIYVGSTCNTLEQRLAKHKSVRQSSSKKHRTLYALMNEIGPQHFYISLLEEVCCDTKLQLLEREAHWVKMLGTLNMQIPGRTKQQYVADTKEQKREYDKERRAKLQERIREEKKEYYQNNRDAINELRKLNRTTCNICNLCVRTDYLRTHQRSNKCQLQAQGLHL